MYDFRSLSPLDFEELVRDLLQEELEITFESFGPGPDQGIDFRFAPAKGGHTIVQAKHYVESGPVSLVQAAGGERNKVKALKPNRYLFVTSVSMRPSLKAKILQKFRGVKLAERDILGKEDLNNLLRKYPNVERKHFKLWLSSTQVLDRIIHSGIYNRTRAELSSIERMIPKFVNNNSVSEAERILSTHGSVVICGQPGVGKTTLARMLTWLHMEQGWSVFIIDDIREAFEVAQEGEKRLIFFDDFLGQVNLSSDLIRAVDRRLPPFLERVKSSKDLRFILTTRDYILRQAQFQSERLSTARIGVAELTLDVGSYTRSVKARLLYNHIYFSDISVNDRDLLLQDDFFLKIIDHENFNPRLIDLLTSADFLCLTGTPIRDTITENLENPQRIWETPYRLHISAEGRALMLAVYFSGRSTLIDDVERSFALKAAALGLNIHRSELPAKFRRALKELEGSVFAIENRRVSFGNPGLRDFLRRIVLEDRLIEAAVATADECREMWQTWRVFNEIGGKPLTEQRAREIWIEALRRLLEGDSGSPLSRFALVMEVYAKFGSAAFVPLAERVIEELRDAELDEADVDESQQVLRKLVQSTAISKEVVEAARNRLVEEMHGILHSCGALMSLDDIEAMKGTLDRFGMDAFGTSDAVRAALESYAQDCRQALSEFNLIEDVDSYEEQLLSLLEEFDIRSSRAEDTIEERRREISEKRVQGRGAWQSVGSGGLHDRISDNAIRSMFAELKRG